MPRQPTDDLTNAGKRLAGIANGYIAYIGPWELRSLWLAVRLEDGSTDGNLYPSMKEAVKHSDPQRCFYFAFRGNIGGLDPREAAIVIDFHRSARLAGIPQSDPDAAKQREPFLSTYGHDVFSRNLRSRLS